LKSEWLTRGTNVTCDELDLSNAIHERALNLVGYKTDVVSTFPYVAIVFVTMSNFNKTK
jgi:hypothetical protein